MPRQMPWDSQSERLKASRPARLTGRFPKSCGPVWNKPPEGGSFWILGWLCILGLYMNILIMNLHIGESIYIYIHIWVFPEMRVPPIAGWFLLGKIPLKLGWWLEVPLWLRKPPDDSLLDDTSSKSYLGLGDHPFFQKPPFLELMESKEIFTHGKTCHRKNFWKTDDRDVRERR